MPKGVSGNPGGRPPEIEPVSLEHAREMALALLVAEEDYIAAIVAAYESGNSTHQIAKALGISHQKATTIIQDESKLSLGDGGFRSAYLRRRSHQPKGEASAYH